MKTAILFALVCLSGYTLADLTCTQSCKDIGNPNITGVTTDDGVTFVFVKGVAFKVVFRGDLAFVSNGKIIILINKSTGVVLHIEGCNGKIVKNLTVDINVVFEAKGDVGGAITNIINASAAATLQVTINFGVLFGYKSKAEIDYTVVFGGIKEAGDIGKASFGVFFGTVVDIAVKKGSSNVTKFTLVAGVIVTSEKDYDKAILVGLTFNLIANTPDADVEAGFTFVLNVVVRGEEKSIGKLIAVLLMKKQLQVSLDLNLVILKEVKIPAILSKPLYVRFSVYSGSFYLVYWNEGDDAKSVTVIFNFNTGKKTELCIFNAALGFDVYFKSGGSFLVYSRTQGSYMFFLGANVEIGGEGMTSVEVGVHFSGAVALDVSKTVSVTALIEKCKSSEQEFKQYLQTSVKLSVEASVRFYLAFSLFLQTQASKSVSLLLKVTYSLSPSSCITYVMTKIDVSANVSFGASTTALVSACTAAPTVLESSSLSASFSATVAVSVGISL